MFQPYLLEWVFHKRNLFAITCLAAAQTLILPIEGKVTGKEAITLRRIAEFWKDGDYEIAKKQIHQFLDHFPSSDAKDHLCLMLGDLYFHEKSYQAAYSAYEKIVAEELADQSLFSRLYSLSQLEDYPGVVELSDLYFKKNRDLDEQLQVHYLTADALVKVAMATSHVERKKEWTERASFHAKYLEKTPYAEDFLFAFAELQKMTQNYSLATQTYLRLADKHPEKREELLFEAATTQLFLDKSAALTTFKNVISLKGERAQAAIFNYLSLLIEAEKYEEFLTAYSQYQAQVPENKSALMQFYIGKSYFVLNQLHEAKEPLLKSVEASGDNAGQLKAALVYLVHCAHATNDLPLLNQAIVQMKTAFPTDLDLAKSLLIRAKLSIDAKRCEEAYLDLEEILHTFPSFGNQEAMLYTSALLLFQEQKWKESQALFIDFLEKYPQSSKTAFVYKHLVNAAIKLGNKESAIPHLSLLLTVAKSEEKQETQFLLAKMLYETYQYEKALVLLEQYINEFPGASNLDEAHLLSANCHYSLQSRPEFFILHAEKILSLKPDFAQKNSLHLYLFNAYTLLGNCENQAADHLYKALSHGNMTIKWENQLWLTHFYLARGIENQENYERASYLVKRALSSTHDPLSLEVLALQYADLLTSKGMHEEKIDLLTALIERQTRESSIDWKYQRRTLLELAKTYEKMREPQKSLAIYNDLIESSTYTTSYTGATALLHRSRILLSEIPLEDRDNEAFLNILNDLKELQIRKNIQSEPIHLEAALDYAFWHSGIAFDPEQKERYAFLLHRIKEDFTSEEDVISKDYLASRHRFQEKEELFQTYMAYLDAEILKVNGERKEAKLAMQQLVANKHLHPYLRERIQNELYTYE